eukprot:2604110-Alexandrium_andersonii.AAC.1
MDPPQIDSAVRSPPHLQASVATFRVELLRQRRMSLVKPSIEEICGTVVLQVTADADADKYRD